MSTEKPQPKNVKQYEVEHPETYFAMLVEIDHDKFTEGLQREINEFWSDAKYRLDSEGGDLLAVVLKMLCSLVMLKSLNPWASVESIIKEFECEEGWTTMDGADGIRLLKVENPSFEYSDMSVSEVPRV